MAHSKISQNERVESIISSFRSSLIFISCFMFFLTTTNAQTTWTGGGDGTNWDDVTNWSTGAIPTTTSDAILPAGSVVIIRRALETAYKVDLFGDAKLTINAGSTLSVFNTSGGANPGDGVRVNDDAMMVNKGNIMVVDFRSSAINIEENGVFENHGDITATGNKPTEGSSGIEVEGLNNLFHNFSSGTISLDSMRTQGIRISNGEIINDGQIDINNCGQNGITSNSGNVGSPNKFTNNKTLNIINDVNASQPSIYIRASNVEFINTGIITIFGNTTGVLPAINLGRSNCASAQFTNGGPCGIINIQSNGAIELVGTCASFINNKTIASVFTGSNDNMGTFTNNGTIQTPNGVFNVTTNPIVGAGAIETGPVPAELLPGCIEPQNIPTLGQWSIINLGMILLIFAIVAIGSRKAIEDKIGLA